MATSKAKYPYIDVEASDVEERNGDRFTGRLVNDKPYAGGKYEYNAPDAPEAGGGRGFVNPPMAKKSSSDKKRSSDEKKAKGGAVGSASKRADGIATRGKTRGRMI